MPDLPPDEAQERLSMRLWSLHPRYLDRQGLLAVWREGLLAKKVLQGKTKGYTKHPQLIRFKKTTEPLAYINAYLQGILEEAQERGYKFQAQKLKPLKTIKKKIILNSGQLQYEYQHLLKKLKTRDKKRYQELKKLKAQAHSLFKTVRGQIEDWERIK